MDTVDILKVCARRWYVMLPILIGGAGVSSQLVQAQETTYTAAASFGLVQSQLTPGTSEDEVNPLGSAGDILVGAALEAQLNSRESQENLGSDDTRGWGPGEVTSGRSFVVRIPQFETTYEVRAWGEDEDEVKAVVDRVVETLPDIADELQVRAAVPPPQRWQPFVLAPTQVDALPSSGWMKLVLAVMGVATLMGAAWSIVVDRVLQWRRARRKDDVGALVEQEPAAPSTTEPAAATPADGRTGPPVNGTAPGEVNGRVPVTRPGSTSPVPARAASPGTGTTKGSTKGATKAATKGSGSRPRSRNRTGSSTARTSGRR